jgi:multidrug resistance protein, MATE family
MTILLSKDYREHYKNTFLLAYPVCLSQLGHVMVGVVDTGMVGQIGTKEQAAVSLANTLYILVLVFAIGVSFGITPLVASAHSRKDSNEISGLLKNGLFINVILGLILFVFLYFSSSLLGRMDQAPEVVDLAIPFFNIMVFSMIPLSIFMSLKQFTEGLSLTKVAMYISIGGNLLNIILNYILIFGGAGFEPMGMMGSCWATFISRLAMAIGMFLYVYLGRDFINYRSGFILKNFSSDVLKKILKIGFPSGLQFAFEVGAFCFAVIMIGWISPESMAAHQIAISFAALTYMTASGVSAATTVRVGNFFGLKDARSMRQAGFSSFIMVIAFMILMAVLLIIFNKVIPGYFNHDEKVIQIASSLFIIAAFFQLSDGVQVVGLGALRGIKDVNIPTAITLVSYWMIGLPLSYFLAFVLDLGVEGIWYGLMAGLTMAALLLFFRFEYVSRKMKTYYTESILNPKDFKSSQNPG